MTINDSDFLQQFEDHTLDPSHFDHLGHLRLAWLYLNRYELELAIDKVTNGISGYAASLGATDKFQHTLTEALVRNMADRIKTSKFGQFERGPERVSFNYRLSPL